MNRAEFEKFINRQQVDASKASTPFDPAQQVQEWQNHLDSLYTSVKGFMAPFMSKGSARLDFKEIQLVEDFSGPYSVRQMSLIIGVSTVVFKPIGTMLIGSKGRVDVQGPRGSARLGLVNSKLRNARQMIRVTVKVSGSPASPPPPPDEPIEWVWKIISPAPQMQFIDLTEDTFFDMISSIADA